MRVSQSRRRPEEKRHHYLWRFWRQAARLGRHGIFDRSWYGRVLVERVEGFATEEQWHRAYGEINEFERTLGRQGMILVKFWLHVSPEEQLAGSRRGGRPVTSSWKLTDEDWRNRDKRAQYEAAVEEMLERCDPTWAPWHVIPGDDKHYARFAVVEAVCDAVEDELTKRGFHL